MRISWGYRIALLYIGFASFIIYFVTRSVNEKIDLVTPEYYAQELKYQDKIESANNNNNLGQPVAFDYDETGISISFPRELQGKDISGSILLFRPSDKTRDRTYTIAPGKEFKQLIPATDLTRGMYRVKVEYQSGGAKYYAENQIVVR